MAKRNLMTWGVVTGMTVGLGISSSVLADGKPLVVVRGSELSKYFSDPKDKGMAQAVKLLSTRLREIPGEVRAIANDPQADEAMAMVSGMMPVVLGLLDHPCEFAIIDQGQMIGQIPDLDIRLVVQTGSTAATENMTRAVQMLMQMAGHGAEPKAWAQTSQMYMEIPEAGQLMFGPAGQDSKSFYVGVDLGRNGMDLSAVSLESPKGLEGAKLDWQMFVDGHAIATFAQRGLNSIDDPQAQHIAEMISTMVPESDFNIVGGGAVHDGLRKAVFRFNGGVQFAEKMSEFAQALVGEIDVAGSPFDLDALRLIPRDINMMGAQAADLTSLMGPAQMVAYQYGLPELAAVVGSIGQNWMWYSSDETGGGGLSSLVFIQPDVQSENMDTALGNLATALNAHAVALHGYVRVRSWESTVGGDVVPIHTITFPGLPVPLSLSMGVVDERLVAGVTPQGLIAAVDHWRSGRPSLLDNAQFRTAGRDLLDGATKISFVDLSRSIMDGYHAAQMLGTLMENFVRSPSDPNRDVGLITPSPMALARNAKPMFSVNKTDGDDYVVIATTDPSILVNVAGAAGASGPIPFLIGAAIVGGAMAQEHGINMPH